jgi:hypothetical protein
MAGINPGTYIDEQGIWRLRCSLVCGWISANADREGMSGVMPEPRTAVMILMEASWADQSGTLQTVSAQMVNKSSMGACIRVGTRVRVGTRMRIQRRWEEFTGITKYCRSDGVENRVGLQRESRRDTAD